MVVGLFVVVCVCDNVRWLFAYCVGLFDYAYLLVTSVCLVFRVVMLVVYGW